VNVNCTVFTFNLETWAEERGSSFCENIFSISGMEEGSHGSCGFSNFGMKYGTNRNVIVPYSRGNELGYENRLWTLGHAAPRIGLCRMELSRCLCCFSTLPNSTTVEILTARFQPTFVYPHICKSRTRNRFRALAFD